jgi:hypothetical protein
MKLSNIVYVGTHLWGEMNVGGDTLDVEGKDKNVNLLIYKK